MNMKNNTLKKYVLGTVQLGLAYGVNNQTGKPNKESAFRILNIAIENGILELDTAAGYGDSEEVIGEFHKKSGKQFEVCTKLILEKENEAEIEKLVNSMLGRLSVSKLAVLYLHRFEQAKNPLIMEQLAEVKKAGKIEKIGISIYEPVELEYIVQNLSDMVDVVQIPYNILDHERWDEWIRRSHEYGIQIYIRSVFLQGLLFKEENDTVVCKLNAEQYISFVKELAGKKKVSVANLLLDYCKNSEADAILIGCETERQLLDNLCMITAENCLKAEDMERINSTIKDVDLKIIDPRRW